MAAHRPVWLLDEPQAALDVASTRLLEIAIASHLASGGLAIVSTHLDLALPDAQVLELGKPGAVQRVRGAGERGMNAFLALLSRDLRLAVRQGSAVGTALGFYLVAVAIIPLGLGPDLNLLSRIAPGILWISFLLSAVLSVDALFQEDRDDGSLDALVLGPLPAELIAASKSVAHWVTTCVPLIAVTPLAGLLLNIQAEALPKLLAALLAGTVGVSFVAGAGQHSRWACGKGRCCYRSSFCRFSSPS